MAETSPPSWPTSATRVGGPGQHDVVADAGHLIGLAHPPNKKSSISGSQARKRGRAQVRLVAALLAVGAVVGPEAVLSLERLVDAGVVRGSRARRAGTR